MSAQQGEAYDRVGNCSQDQWATDGGADTEVFCLRGTTEGNGSKSYRALGQSRAEGSQHGSGGGGRETQPLPQPFNAVDEVFAGKIDRAGGRQE